MDIQPDLSVITLFPDNAQSGLFDHFLHTLFENADPVLLEVFAIHSGAAEKILLFEKNYPQVRYFDRGSLPGTAAQRNLALQQAKGRYLALMDYDLSLQPGCLLAMIRYLDDHPDVGMAGPKIVNGYGQTEPNRRGRYSLASLLWTYSALGRLFPNAPWHKGFTQLDEPLRTGEVKALAGGAHFIRREVIEEIGLLDPAFDHHFEEFDYYARSGRLGWHHAFVAEAVMRHARPERYSPSLVLGWPSWRMLANIARLLMKKWFLRRAR